MTFLATLSAFRLELELLETRLLLLQTELTLDTEGSLHTKAAEALVLGLIPDE